MTREEKISKAAYSQYCNSESICFNLMCDSFKQGAKWADNHPKSPWISVKDDLPCNHKELTPKDYTVEVLTLDDCNSYRIVRMWEFDNKWVWGIDDLPITHWMKFPEPPKE